MIRKFGNRYDLTPSTTLFLLMLVAFFGAFLIYPLLYIFKESFWINGRFDLTYFKLIATDETQREYILNSFKIGFTVTILTTLLSLPLAYVLVRYDFIGRGLLQGLILVPMIMPPFVGAIGMKQLFARYGSVNQILMEIGLIDRPIDWFAGGFWGVVVLETLHLYPIMYLNIAAALANVDPSLEEAAENLGATRFRLFRTITFPLMLPGYFAGAIIVFIWAFTDLGTPLMFEYRRTIPVQIFDRVKDISANPMGYALVVLVILLTMASFFASKRFLGTRRYEMLSRGHVAGRERKVGPIGASLIYLFVVGVILIALIPHISVLLTSLTPPGKWFMTVLPESYTFKHYAGVFTHPTTATSIRNSFKYSLLSTLADIILGVIIAYILTRKRIPGRDVLDATAMLPLALPGIVLAFGYVGSFAGTPIDPRKNPTALLVISYAVRRLPYMIRSAYAGFQQTSITLEEASLNLGASPLRTLYKITLPLVMANLVAGGILAFSFAMLEVSDSLILAMQSRFYPITKAIYDFSQRLGDGPYIASAMGMLGMILLTASLVAAGRFLGKRMGELFRA
jgi:iron(III) transport system permease protein